MEVTEPCAVADECQPQSYCWDLAQAGYTCPGLGPDYLAGFMRLRVVLHDYR
jgi:hypothetical protein